MPGIEILKNFFVESAWDVDFIKDVKKIRILPLKVFINKIREVEYM